jgi:hypothetical protein
MAPDAAAFVVYYVLPVGRCPVASGNRKRSGRQVQAITNSKFFMISSISLPYQSLLRPIILSHRRLVHVRRGRSGPPAEQSVRAHRQRMFDSSNTNGCRGGVACSAESSDLAASSEAPANPAVKTVLRVYYTRRDGQCQVQSFILTDIHGDVLKCGCSALQRKSRMGRSIAKAADSLTKRCCGIVPGT